MQSRRDWPGFCAVPAARTVTAAPAQSGKSPAQTRVGWAKGTVCFKSMASPSALARLASMRTISEASPLSSSAYAKVEPTLPAPTIATFTGPSLTQQSFQGPTVCGRNACTSACTTVERFKRRGSAVVHFPIALGMETHLQEAILWIVALAASWTGQVPAPGSSLPIEILGDCESDAAAARNQKHAKAGCVFSVGLGLAAFLHESSSGISGLFFRTPRLRPWRSSCAC